MIHVDRWRVNVPAAVLDKAARFQSKVLKYAIEDRINDILHKQALSVLWDFREILEELFRGKCAYCESRLGVGGRGEIENYRPKRNAIDLTGERSPLHYWWLAVEWDNLLIACQSCNHMKGARFPILGERAKIGTTGWELAAEQPLLLNPCLDYPEEHLIFLENGSCVGITQRGQVTIEIMGLNRVALVQARREAWHDMEVLLSVLEKTDEASLFDHIRRRLEPDQSYTATCIQCVRRWFADRPRAVGGLHSNLDNLLDGLGASMPIVSEQVEQKAIQDYEDQQRKQRSYSVEVADKQQVASYYLGAKRIERIEIRNFRLIEELVLDFPLPLTDREPWMVLLGENGVGKSSVLQGIALALMGEVHANSLGLDASRFFRRQAGDDEEGYVRVHLTNVGPVEVRFTRKSSTFSVQPKEPKVLVLGYGATRLLPHEARRTASEQRAIRILNLFDPTAPLSDTETWLLDKKAVSDDRFRELTDALIPLLMLPEDARFHRDGSEIELEHRGIRRPLRNLSDGYQSLVALIGDIAIGVSEKWASLKEAEGLVLLDEIEVHLHPTWKISIVERLRNACPRLTFLITTHDPLCLKGLAPEEIVVLKTDVEERVYAETEIPPMTHLRVDQLLTSFLFNLESTRDQVTGPMVARYSVLLGKKQRNQAEEQEFQDLQVALSRTLTSAVTPAQRRVEEAVKQVLGMLAGESAADMMALEAEVRRQVSDLLVGEP